MGDLLERRAEQGMGMRVLVEGTIACNDLYFTTNPFFNETASTAFNNPFVRSRWCCLLRVIIFSSYVCAATVKKLQQNLKVVDTEKIYEVA